MATRKPFRWAIVADYDSPFGPKGTILSRHITADAANKKIRTYGKDCGNWLAIRLIESLK